MLRTLRLVFVTPWVVCVSLFVPAHTLAQEAVVNSALNAPLMYQILQAEMTVNQGNIPLGYALMLDAARRSGSDKLYERAVELGLETQQAQAALGAAQAWQKASPDSQKANRYVLQILIGTNRVDEVAEPLMRELHGLSGDARRTAIQMVPSYFVRSTHLAVAAKVVERALAPDLASPAYGPAAWSTIGFMRWTAGQAADAWAAAQRGAALDRSAEQPVALALNLMEANVPEAETMVQQFLLQHPAATPLRMQYGRTLIGQKRYADALTQMRVINQQTPAFADAWLVRGSLEVQEKRPLEAKAALEQYVKLIPGDASTPPPADGGKGPTQAYLLLSQIAENEGRLAEGLAYLDQITSSADAVRVAARRAMLLSKQGKLAEALDTLRAHPGTQPEDVQLSISVHIQILRNAKQWQAAYDVLGAAVRTFPKDPDFAYDQAMMAEKLGRLDDMERHLRHVMATAPDYYHAYNALGYSLADRNTRLIEARQLLDKASAMAPQDPYIMDSVGWLEYRSGNLPLALQILTKAYSVREDADIAAHLGEVLWVTGQREAAVQVWRQGLELQPDNETLQETIQRLKPPQ
ncbi:MAG: tetratricopeptide repeat protein [Rhodoferax sp.]|nr:tetratricopeptide repeat protein [Rhodoferax sp.]